MKYKLLIGIVVLICTLSGRAQEDVTIGTDEVTTPKKNQFQEVKPERGAPDGEFAPPPPPSGPSINKKVKEEKNTSKKTKKKKPSGPKLVAEHKKRKQLIEFSEGEFVKFKTNTDDKIQKGILIKIDRQYVTIDSNKIQVNKLEMVGKNFTKTMGWRSAGVANFAIGTGLTAAGVALCVVSAELIDPNSTDVIWGTLGVVAGTGTGLVGIHLMVKGGKGVFQSSKLKTEKGWSFSVK